MRFVVFGIASVAIFGLLIPSAASGNGVAVPSIAVSTASPAQLGAVNFENDALVAYDPTTNFALEVFNLDSAFPEINRNLDAAHILANGNVVISTQAGDTAGGVAFTESDLVELDPINGTVAMLLDASVVGLNDIGSVPNINAVHVRENGNILFSTAANSGVEFKGVTYTKDDVIEYDPVNDTGSLFFDGSLITGETGFVPDVLGLSVVDDTHILIAANDEGTDNPLTLGGVSFDRDDVVLYNTSNDTSTLYLNGEDEFSATGEIIDAITPAVVPEPTSLVVLLLAGPLLIRRKR